MIFFFEIREFHIGEFQVLQVLHSHMQYFNEVQSKHNEALSLCVSQEQRNHVAMLFTNFTELMNKAEDIRSAFDNIIEELKNLPKNKLIKAIKDISKKMEDKKYLLGFKMKKEIRANYEQDIVGFENELIVKRNELLFYNRNEVPRQRVVEQIQYDGGVEELQHNFASNRLM